jgi:uncharacterized protein YbjT (DUF2867 family)
MWRYYRPTPGGAAAMPMNTSRASAPFSELPVLVAGATGYIGARLVPRLLDSGYAVRCLTRAPRKLESRSWIHHPNVSAVEGDLVQTKDLAALMRGCGAAFYLAHAMLSGGADDGARAAEAARRFAVAASEARISRIIYLGGLGETTPGRSERLASRGEVGRILSSGDVPVTIFRTAMILGSGSASFEILRYLVERLPVVLSPTWLRSEFQPISVHDVLQYLVASLATPLTVGQTLEIGGPDIVTFEGLMRITAEEMGLRRRFFVPVRMMSPRLSALWIRAVTPVPLGVAGPLVESLRNRVVCRDHEAATLMPFPLRSARESVGAALRRQARGEIESNWSDAGVVPGDPDWAGGRVFFDQRETMIDASADAAFDAACRVGGPHGWYTASFLWWVRGRLDKMVGGPGLLRGRRDPNTLRYGDAVDFWRVSAMEPGRRLRLNAEMKLPGEASLEFAVEPVPVADMPDGRAAGSRCRLTQTATFVPHGLPGLAYWYSMVPFHAWIFTGMLRGIRRTAERLDASQAAVGGNRRDSAGQND